MNRVLLFLFGSIYFCAGGGFSERFLNLCDVRNIKLHSLKCEKGVLYAETSLASFRKIRRCARGSGMKVKIIAKKGLPFLYARIAHRTGLAVGVTLACILLFFYSRSVWCIEVRGNEQVPASEIVRVLAQNGVREGTLKKDIHKKQLNYILCEEIAQIAWLNIGLDGSKLSVEIREVTPKPENKDSETYCNIVAAKDGVIAGMRVYEGESVVMEGEGVVGGEMLVSGVMEHEQMKRSTFHRSAADIYAYTQSDIDFKIDKQVPTAVYTGKEKRQTVLRVFRLKIPLYLFSANYQNSEVSMVEKPLVIAGKKLPLALVKYEIKEVRAKQKTLDEAAAGVLARAKKRAFERSLADDTRILSVRESVKENKHAFVFSYHYELYENIAKKQVFEIETKNVHNNVENSA